MRILFVVNFYPPQPWGTVAERCQAMAKYLDNNGHDLFILTGNYGVAEKDNRQLSVQKLMRFLKYVNYENAGSYERWKVDKYNYHVTWQIAEEIMPDLTFFWDMDGISVAPVLAIQKLKIPKIFEVSKLWIDKYVHEDFISRSKLKLKSFLPQTVGGKIDFNPSIVNSRRVEKELQLRYGLQRFYYLPVGVDIPSVVSLPDFGRSLKLISRWEIAENKNFTTIFIALQKLQKQGIRFEYNLFGKLNPQLIYKLKKEIDHYGLGKEIQFHTQQKDEDFCYENNDIYLIPPGSVEIDLEILQAWANQRLLLIPEVATELKLSPGVDLLLYQDNLFEQLLAVAEDSSNARKIAAAGYQHVSQKYNLAKIMQQTAEILLKETMEQKQK
ncbi:MAG: glycosyltransferase [Candidatus Cloacimonadales bacterium]